MKFGIAVGKDNTKAKDLSEKIENYLSEKGHEVAFDEFMGADFAQAARGATQQLSTEINSYR